MKRLGLLLMLVLIAGAVFAGGQSERLTILYLGETVVNGVNLQREAEKEVLKQYPNMEFEYMQVDVSTGSAITMDTLLATGEAPDLYTDSMVRLSRYITPDFALALPEDITEPFIDLQPFTRGGKVYALPMNGGAQGMAINLDLMEKVGFEVPDNWTIDDFVEMCRVVKEYSDKTGEEVYGTGLFAGNQSGDYLWMNWFATFGVDLYAEDYAYSTQRDGGDKVWDFFQWIQEQGYIPPNSANRVDDDYVIDFASGKLAATAFYEGWVKPYFDSVIEQGLIDKPFNYKFVSFPYNAKPCTNFSGWVVNKDTENKEAALIYLKAITSKAAGNLMVKYQSSVPYRKDISVFPDNPRDKEIIEIASKGTYDLGVTNTWFAEVRAEGFPILQMVLNGEISGKEAADMYSDKVDEIIK